MRVRAAVLGFSLRLVYIQGAKCSGGSAFWVVGLGWVVGNNKISPNLAQGLEVKKKLWEKKFQ